MDGCRCSSPAQDYRKESRLGADMAIMLRSGGVNEPEDSTPIAATHPSQAGSPHRFRPRVHPIKLQAHRFRLQAHPVKLQIQASKL